MPMSEEEWRSCSNTNAMFAAIEPPTNKEISAFTMECCRRIRKFVTDDVTLKAIAAMEAAPDHATIPIELALAVNKIGALHREDLWRRNTVAMAVSLSISRSFKGITSEGFPSDWVVLSANRLDTLKLVAEYCQFEVLRHEVGFGADGAAISDNVDGRRDGSHQIDTSPPLGGSQQSEAMAHCDLIRSIFTRRLRDPEPFVPQKTEYDCSMADALGAAILLLILAAMFTGLGWLTMAVAGKQYRNYSLAPYVAVPVLTMLALFGLINPRVSASLFEGSRVRMTTWAQILQITAIVLGAIATIPFILFMEAITK